MITLCTQHGESAHGKKARCSLSRQARGAWRRYARKHPDRAEGLIMCCVSKEDPDHGAVAADDTGGIHRIVHGAHADARWRAEVMRCLKSAIRSGKISRTKKARAARRQESA